MSEERQIITITEDGLVQLVKERTIQTATLPSFLRNIISLDIETPILPAIGNDGYSTLYYKRKGEMSGIFVAVPPRKAKVSYRNRKTVTSREGEEGDKIQIFEIAFPWKIYTLLVQGNGIVASYLRFAKSRPSRMSDVLCYAATPNIHDGTGTLCEGSAFAENVNSARTLNDRVTLAVAYLEQATFNNDLGMSREYMPKEICEYPETIGYMFDAWEKWTRQAGDKWREEVLKVSWNESESFGSFVEKVKV